MKNYEWNGKGVVSFKGKDYGRGVPLPSDIPKEFIKRHLKDGELIEVDAPAKDDSPKRRGRPPKQAEFVTDETQENEVQENESTEG